MFNSRMINRKTMRILKDPLARFSNLSSSTVSARFRNSVSRSVVEGHGRSFASSSSVASQSPTRSKTCNKVSRDERKALVESFVNRYRATNGGRFPTLKATHKEVGGSYYVVRDIFQELKFVSKNPSVRAAQVLSVQVADAENDASSVDTSEAEAGSRSGIPSHVSSGSSSAVAGFVSPAGEPGVVELETTQKRSPLDVSNSGSVNGNHRSDAPVIITMDDNFGNIQKETIPQNDIDSKGDSISQLTGNNRRDVDSDACFKTADPEEKPNVFVNSKRCDSQRVEEERHTPTHIVSENPNEKTETVNTMHLGGQEFDQDRIAEPVDSAPLEAENRAREVSDRGVGDAQTRREGSVWSNIKSLAEGIMSFWRKG